MRCDPVSFDGDVARRTVVAGASHGSSPCPRSSYHDVGLPDETNRTHDYQTPVDYATVTIQGRGLGGSGGSTEAKVGTWSGAHQANGRRTSPKV